MPFLPRISVIIPTRDRAALLTEALDSIESQVLSADDYEIVVVDDGSQDETPEVCRAAAARLPLRYRRIDPSGIAAAKNLAIFSASAPLLLFFDDDDVAAPDLLTRHLDAHEEHAAEHVAVLGHTGWAPALEVTEVMRYVTDVGGFLFSYGALAPGQVLDHTYFWGGRTSCKRSFLARHGIFNQAFTFGCEDIELGHRLAQHGLKVVYDPSARSAMNRPVTFADFCRRCERQGRAQFQFGAVIHRGDPAVEAYCELQGADERWAAAAPGLASDAARVDELELLVALPERETTGAWRDELHRLYRHCFLAYRAKGIVEAAA